jgi:transmembrane sensor
MDEKEFDDIIRRCLSGQATKQETVLVEKWLDQRANEDPFSKLSVTEKEKTRIAMYKGLSSRMTALRQSSGRSKSNVSVFPFYQAAATIALLALFFYVLLQFTPNSSASGELTIIHSVTSTDASKKIILSDSSIIWLRGNSSIIYPEKFNGDIRNVKLQGEALFEVTRDPDHPFVIQCGGLMAKVLGTSFNIKSSETHIEVLVLTGEVQLSSKGVSDPLIVRPNERVVYDEAENQMEKFTARENEKTAKTSGTEYSMRFNATRMEEIIRRIEGKFDVRVSLSDERLGNCTITADFTDQPLDRTLNMISQTLEIKYEINGTSVAMEGVGCD